MKLSLLSIKIYVGKNVNPREAEEGYSWHKQLGSVMVSYFIGKGKVIFVTHNYSPKLSIAINQRQLSITENSTG